MPAGLIVKNNTGQTQIDDTFNNICLKDTIRIPSAQWTVESYPGVGTGSFTTFTQPDEPRMFFLAQGSIAFRGKTVSGGIATYRVIGSGDVVLYAFGESSAVGTGFGLQVFNANGVLKFDANNKFFRFVSATKTPLPPASVSLPTDGRKYAVALDTYETRWVSQPFSTGYVSSQLILVTTVSGNSVAIGQGVSAYIPPLADPPVSSTSFPNLSLMTVIDVTGFD